MSTPDWNVRTLGERRFGSPLSLSETPDDGTPSYVPDGIRVLLDAEVIPRAAVESARSFEKAGPRSQLFFEPKKAHVGILTAGGVCPGINNVIRSLVLHLFYRYGVERLTGFRYGFAGLDPQSGVEPIALGPEAVRHVHTRGGTMLGTSRGEHDLAGMVDALVARKIDCLFAIGGDGTMRGAHAIYEEAARRGLDLAVVGIPKTIDNDIPFVDKTFGFETAVSMARVAIDAAHTEAMSALNGIGLVKLMGRNAGFIAAHATLASHDVNVCLVPESQFEVGRLLTFLENRLKTRGHAVVVVAEGCGIRLATSETTARDASGNLRFASPELDIGVHLRDAIARHFAEVKTPISLKYIDPSYMLRGVTANAMDSVFCDELARYAAHAAMAGKTDVMIGRWHRAFTHVPLPLVLSSKKRIDLDKELWLAVMETTGQPRLAEREARSEPRTSGVSGAKPPTVKLVGG